MKMRDIITRQIQGLKNDASDARDSTNWEEDGTDEFAREMALNLASSRNDGLIAVEEALRRIEDGTYGYCEMCSKVIAKPRIKALPFARTCIECQAETEKMYGRQRVRPTAA